MADRIPNLSTVQSRFKIETRAKLLSLLAAFVLLLFGQTIPVLSMACAFVLALLILSRVPSGWLLQRVVILLTGLLPFLMTMPFLHDSGQMLYEWGRLRISTTGLYFTLVLLLRSLGLTLWVLLILATTSWTDGMVAARRLGLPRKLTSILILVHRHIYLLYDELSRLRLAIRLRAFRNRMNHHSQRTAGQLISSLFTRGMDRAENLHQSMLVRGFTGDLPTLRKEHIRSHDRWFLLVAFLFHSGLLVLDLALR